MPADRLDAAAPDTADRDLAVVDASVFAALTFGESRSQEAADLLHGAVLVAPGLVVYEMTNIARAKIRGNPGVAGSVALAFMRWRDLPVRLVTPDFDEVLAIALVEGLSAYDAAYVQVARKLDAPLLTFDERLAHAARTTNRSASRAGRV
jgi:predicted nucleic acid-binding protein